jgi:hypothetical protein
MPSRRAILPVLILAGCATAAGHGNPGQDASNQQHDAPGGGDGPPHIPDSPAGGCAMPFTGALATWTLTGAAGTQATTAASTTAQGVTAGAIARSAGLVATAGTNSINSSNWPAAATLDSTRYYTFSLTPPSGCAMDLTQLAIDLHKSNSGPAMAAIATSDDAFTQTTSVGPDVASTPALAVTGSTASVEIRVYGFAAGNPLGTLRVQNTLSVTGSLH